MVKTFINYVRRLFLSKKANRHNLAGPPKLWMQKRTFQIDFLKSHGLLPHHDLVDIGCGTLRGGIALIDYLQPGRYTGIDARIASLNEATRELLEENLLFKNPKLIHCLDMGNLPSVKMFDFIWSFSVLIHMEDTIAEGVFKYVSKYLKSGGVFYANVNYGNRKDYQWQEFPVVFRSLIFYDQLAKKYNLMATELGTLGELGHLSGNANQDCQRMLKFNRV